MAKGLCWTETLGFKLGKARDQDGSKCDKKRLELALISRYDKTGQLKPGDAYGTGPKLSLRTLKFEISLPA